MVRKTERRGNKDDKGNMASAGDKADAATRVAWTADAAALPGSIGDN